MKSRVIARESTGRRLIEQSRVRLLTVGLFFSLSFFSIAWRLCDVALAGGGHDVTVMVSDPDDDAKTEKVDLKEALGPLPQRGDIVDRNGVLLATSLMTGSVFADPKQVPDQKEAASELAHALGMNRDVVFSRLSRRHKSFVWIKRQLTPREEARVNNLGIPGVYFAPEEKRVYPFGRLFSHTVGYVGIDNNGLAGVERSMNERLDDADSKPVTLSLDVRLQNIMREEVSAAMKKFHAESAAGVILDMRNGELLSMVSLPDFDPNHPGDATADDRFNRVTLGDYEMGSTFKTFTMAMAMEDGVATMKSKYDATHPLKVDGLTIHDDHDMHRWISVPEIYAYSSNIGAARIGLQVGAARQKAFLEKLGMMQPVDIDLPARATPLYPSQWRDINTATVAYGQGISVTPLHLVRGIAAMVDGGILPHLTVLKDGNDDQPEGDRVISSAVSKNIRQLMRLVVEHGTGQNANVAGYDVGGKTGTAQIASHGRYALGKRLSSFVGVFPIDHPHYIVLVMLDDPKGNATTGGIATASVTAVPAAADVIARMGPLLGMEPESQAADDAEKFWPASVTEGKKVYHVAAQ